jgi:hypothetical protein
MGMFPVAEQRSFWTPPWRAREQGNGELVVLWTVPPVLWLDVTLSAPASSTWIRAWLQRYLERQDPRSASEDDFTFFYVVFGELGAGRADGTVDGVSVIEAGLGGDPVGPISAMAGSVDDIVKWAINSLS